MRIVRIGMSLIALVIGISVFIALDVRDTVVERAHAGDPEAQFVLAFRYSLGRDLDYDPDRAAYWYRMAAENGHPGSMNNLAVLMMLGVEGRRDPFRAFSLFSEASRMGQLEAKANLGESYRTGSGVPPDPSKGTSLIRLASLEVPPPGFEEALREGWIIVEPPEKTSAFQALKVTIQGVVPDRSKPFSGPSADPVFS